MRESSSKVSLKSLKKSKHPKKTSRKYKKKVTKVGTAKTSGEP